MSLWGQEQGTGFLVCQLWQCGTWTSYQPAGKVTSACGEGGWVARRGIGLGCVFIIPIDLCSERETWVPSTPLPGVEFQPWGHVAWVRLCGGLSGGSARKALAVNERRATRLLSRCWMFAEMEGKTLCSQMPGLRFLPLCFCKCRN